MILVQIKRKPKIKKTGHLQNILKVRVEKKQRATYATTLCKWMVKQKARRIVKRLTFLRGTKEEKKEA